MEINVIPWLLTFLVLLVALLFLIRHLLRAKDVASVSSVAEEPHKET